MSKTSQFQMARKDDNSGYVAQLEQQKSRLLSSTSP